MPTTFIIDLYFLLITVASHVHDKHEQNVSTNVHALVLYLFPLA